MAASTLTELNTRLSKARVTAEGRGSRQEFAIRQGLRVRVYPSGKAAFAYRYKAPGTNALRTVTLSPIGKRVSAADLENAEELHRASKRDRDSAIDPKALRDRLRQEAVNEDRRMKAERAQQSFTVRRLVRLYLDHVSSRKRSWKEDERIFDQYVLPVIGDMPWVDVDLKAVRKVLGKLDSTPAMKKNTQAATRACWRWHDAAAANPWQAERVPVPRPRERTLSVKELRDLMKRLDVESDPGADAAELILLTGVRRLEAMEARREEFDGNQWRIPPGRMKANREHVVLLSKQARKLVDSLLTSHKSDWLFPSPIRPDMPISRERAYKWLNRKDVTYTLHDLRRTLSSHLGERLVHDAVIDRILAHRKQGVIKHYNIAKLTEPARKAWQDWADYLDSLRRPNVVKLETDA